MIPLVNGKENCICIKTEQDGDVKIKLIKNQNSKPLCFNTDLQYKCSGYKIVCFDLECTSGDYEIIILKNEDEIYKNLAHVS